MIKQLNWIISGLIAFCLAGMLSCQNHSTIWQCYKVNIDSNIMDSAKVMLIDEKLCANCKLIDITENCNTSERLPESCKDIIPNQQLKCYHYECENINGYIAIMPFDSSAQLQESHYTIRYVVHFTDNDTMKVLYWDFFESAVNGLEDIYVALNAICVSDSIVILGEQTAYFTSHFGKFKLVIENNKNNYTIWQNIY